MTAASEDPLMEEDTLFPSDTDLDFSFASCASTATTDRAFSSSARTSLTLSFNESRLSTSSATCTVAAHRPHSRSAPHWTAIKAATALSPDGALQLRHLKLLRHLGTGNLGRVFLCRLRDCDPAVDSGSFALKVVDRDALTAKKLSQVLTEGQILSVLDHPFLPTLYAHLEVSHYTCLLIDYCPNGDINALLRRQPRYNLPLAAARFYAAEVLVALEYLHAIGVVYRDLKPENILLRDDGHIMLSDFDLCFKADVVPTFESGSISKTGPTKTRWSCFGKPASQETAAQPEFVAEPTAAFSKSCVGTHEYLAPEIIAGNGHGNGVDWWAYGVFIYEMLYGTTPFKGDTKEATLRNIASSRPVRFHVAEEREEEGMTEARGLIEKLLVKDPRRRLGSTRGAADIKRHPFFGGIKWALIRNYKAPEIRGLVRKERPLVGHVSTAQGNRWWRRGLGRGFGIHNERVEL